MVAMTAATIELAAGMTPEGSVEAGHCDRCGVYDLCELHRIRYDGRTFSRWLCPSRCIGEVDTEIGEVEYGGRMAWLPASQAADAPKTAYERGKAAAEADHAAGNPASICAWSDESAFRRGSARLSTGSDYDLGYVAAARRRRMIR